MTGGAVVVAVAGVLRVDSSVVSLVWMACSLATAAWSPAAARVLRLASRCWREVLSRRRWCRPMNEDSPLEDSPLTASERAMCSSRASMVRRSSSVRGFFCLSFSRSAFMFATRRWISDAGVRRSSMSPRVCDPRVCDPRRMVLGRSMREVVPAAYFSEASRIFLAVVLPLAARFLV